MKERILERLRLELNWRERLYKHRVLDEDYERAEYVKPDIDDLKEEIDWLEKTVPYEQRVEFFKCPECGNTSDWTFNKRNFFMCKCGRCALHVDSRENPVIKRVEVKTVP